MPRIARTITYVILMVAAWTSLAFGTHPNELVRPSVLDRDYCLLLYGGALLQRGQFAEAEDILTRLAYSSSFLTPDALVMMRLSAEKQGHAARVSACNIELSQRFPKYSMPTAR